MGLAPPRLLQPGGAPPLACTTRQTGVPLGACLDQGPGFYTRVARCQYAGAGAAESILNIGHFERAVATLMQRTAALGLRHLLGCWRGSADLRTDLALTGPLPGGIWRLVGKKGHI